MSSLIGSSGAWRGGAAQAFGDHMAQRCRVPDLADHALAASAGALRQYAARIEQAQRAASARSMMPRPRVSASPATSWIPAA